ncbi:MAG: class I SAM-dependent methyltransferase [Niabella sp.]
METTHYSHCPACKSDKNTGVFSVKDYTVSGEQFQILECGNCSLRFTQDVPVQDAIGKYYKSEDYISHTDNGKGLVNKLYKKVRKLTMQQKFAIVKKYTRLQKGALLDIGCGTGSFLYTMQTQGWRVTGLEPDADARQVAQSLHGLQVLPSHEIFSLQTEAFNAITLWHVLEHVHQLHEYVAQFKKLMAPGGKLFIAVPNYTSKDAKSYGKYWAAYDVPRHLYHFSPKSMDVLMQQHGLSVIKKLPMWFDSFYVGMLSSRYKTGKINYPSAILHGLSSNINAIDKVEECSSVIYVIEKTN